MSEPVSSEGAGHGTDRRGLTTGIAFVVIGLAFLLDELGVFELRLASVLPLLLIASGVWVLFGRTMSGGRRR